MPADGVGMTATTISTGPAHLDRASALNRSGPVLDVVIPVHNEQVDLEPSVRRLYAHLSATVPYPFRITVADNASTDDTRAIAAKLARELPEVEVLTLAAKGRGRALRAAWSASDAPVLVYLDVDLSTDLAALLPLLRGTLATRFSDAQCGFKAIRADVARQLLPLVEDTGWFFDTELLVLAERAGLRIHEVPVDWVDDPDSRVDIPATIVADLKGIARLGWALATRDHRDHRDPARARRADRANSYYAAAVQAGTVSWKALFFGSFDASSFITVDKPPASLWVMALSGRLFGFSSWSMLVPQALAGVASVALLYAAVRRWAGPVGGLLAGTVLALTPVAVLMFRFNNPDALLTLLLVAAGYAVVRATERASLRWLVLAGALVGLGFLTKMLQAFLVLPAFAVVYLLAAPLRRWLHQQLRAGAGLRVQRARPHLRQRPARRRQRSARW